MKTAAYIDGKWIEKKKTFSVLNPFNGKKIARVPDLTKADAIRAIEAAHKAFPSWSSLPALERSAKLTQMAALMEKGSEKLAKLITLEQGKPLTEARGEITLGIHALKWLAEEGCRIHGYTQCDPDATRSSLTLRQPLGVVSAITPWNFPSYVPLKSLAALAAGCTLVLKPAEDTPLSALALADLSEKAGIPPGVFNVLPCKNPKEIGTILATHPLVSKITFTGSTEVGKHLLKLGASTVKKATLELGGNCPFIAFDDADLDKAVEGALSLKFFNCGQCCNGINRFLIHTSIHDAFLERCLWRAQQLSCGSGLEPVDLGPLINKQAKQKVDTLVRNALSHGAIPHLISSHKNLLCSPILLTNCTPEMRFFREEIFGPALAFYRFTTEKEAIALANDTRHGLAAYFYSENLNRCLRVAKALEAGTIGVNTTNVYSITLPFGGWKESGLGREAGIIESLNDYSELKAVSFGRL